MASPGRNRTGPSGSVHGVLVVDKPSGMTSHDVVAQARRAFKTRRIGHAGTLDPMATGVLVLLLGEATKLSSVLTTDRKSYEARVTFGTSTDSWDADGKVLKRVEISPSFPDGEDLEKALAVERTRRLQIPPQVSAIKVDGQRAYALARKGETVEMEPRDVTVHHLELSGRAERSVDLSVTVSKGYYVRALARDLGDALSVPAHLARLRRTHSGPFDLSSACALPFTGKESLVPITDAARRSLPVLEVNEEGQLRLEQGKRLRPEDLETPLPTQGPALFAAFFRERLVALVEPSDRSEFRVKRGINDPSPRDSSLPPAKNHG